MLGGSRGGLTGPSPPALPRAAPGAEGGGRPGRCPRSPTLVSGAGAGALCMGTGLHRCWGPAGLGAEVRTPPRPGASAMAGSGPGSRREALP